MRPLDISYGQPALDYLADNEKVENAAKMPFYLYGHPVEIANRLIEKSQDKGFKFEKYPLIAFRMDVPEPVRGGLSMYRCNIAFLAKTDRNYNSEERIEKVVKPILVPLYERFLKGLVSVNLFTWEGDSRRPDHDPIIRLYWGEIQKNGNAAHTFNDPLDAIEITIELYRSKNCKRQ